MEVSFRPRGTFDEFSFRKTFSRKSAYRVDGLWIVYNDTLASLRLRNRVKV